MPNVTPPSDDMSFISRSLHSRMVRQYKTTLVLGAQTGALFRDPELSTMLEPFGLSAVGSLKASAHFSQMYRILTRPGLFSKAEIEAIFTSVLRISNTSSADLCLAELVKLGLFDTIVTTTADDLLEQALLQVGLRELRDFTVLNLASEVRKGTLHNILQGRKQDLCCIIRIFGALTAQNYVTSDRYQYLGSNHALSDLLRGILRSDCLVIGLDPVWDEELYRVFPEDGNALWFVNAEELDEASPLYKACRARNARNVTGEPGSYDRFITDLYSVLATSPSPASPPSAPAVSATATGAIKVFLSYAPEDEQLLNKLLTHLAILQREQKIRTWYNRKILPGQQRAEEISHHLNSAKLILLLVSADFLASDYIYSIEMKRALERQSAGEAYIVPIILRPVDWHNTPFGSLSPLPTNGKAVTSWRDSDSALEDITRGIRAVIAHLSTQAS